MQWKKVFFSTIRSHIGIFLINKLLARRAGCIGAVNFKQLHMWSSTKWKIFSNYSNDQQYGQQKNIMCVVLLSLLLILELILGAALVNFLSFLTFVKEQSLASLTLFTLKLYNVFRITQCKWSHDWILI